MAFFKIKGVDYEADTMREAIVKAFPDCKYIVWMRSASDYSYEEYSVDRELVIVYVKF